jgi:tRNA pseudouridine55 synthase
MGGVLVVDKPRGPTSHDVVWRLRKALRTRAVGHCGTLDPMATGVLVVAVGEATKLVPWLTAHDKSYEASVALGLETDTLDAEGRELRRVAPGAPLLQALGTSRPGAVHEILEAAFAGERARTEQIPPAFSAVRKDGERAMDRARRGEAVDLVARDVRLRRIDLVACSPEPPLLQVVVDVSKGYYVRALARDLAAALGTVGHLTALRRTRSGCFGIDEALPLDAPPGELAARVQPLELAAARALPLVRLTEAGAREARHGRAVAAEDMAPVVDGDAAWIAPDGALVAVGRVGDDARGRVVRGMVPPPPPGPG